MAEDIAKMRFQWEEIDRRTKTATLRATTAQQDSNIAEKRSRAVNADPGSSPPPTASAAKRFRSSTTDRAIERAQDLGGSAFGGSPEKPSRFPLLRGVSIGKEGPSSAEARQRSLGVERPERKSEGPGAPPRAPQGPTTRSAARSPERRVPPAPEVESPSDLPEKPAARSCVRCRATNKACRIPADSVWGSGSGKKLRCMACKKARKGCVFDEPTTTELSVEGSGLKKEQKGEQKSTAKEQKSSAKEQLRESGVSAEATDVTRNRRSRSGPSTRGSMPPPPGFPPIRMPNFKSGSAEQLQGTFIANVEANRLTLEAMDDQIYRSESQSSRGRSRSSRGYSMRSEGSAPPASESGEGAEGVEDELESEEDPHDGDFTVRLSDKAKGKRKEK
jgi:hypothetical protein